MCTQPLSRCSRGVPLYKYAAKAGTDGMQMRNASMQVHCALLVHTAHCARAHTRVCARACALAGAHGCVCARTRARARARVRAHMHLHLLMPMHLLLHLNLQLQLQLQLQISGGGSCSRTACEPWQNRWDYQSDLLRSMTYTCNL